MNFKIKGSNLFYEQLDEFGEKTPRILDEKIQLLKNNPFRFKRLKHQKILFKIRFKYKRKEKRLIYQVKKGVIELLFIINRNKDYRDLDKFLEKIH